MFDQQHATVSSEPAVEKYPNLRPFQKGTSGNPTGKTKAFGEIQALAKSKSKKAFDRIVELIDADDPRVALMAAKEVLDRAYGKPRTTEADEDDKRNVTINIVKYADGNHAAQQLDAPIVSVRSLAIP